MAYASARVQMMAICRIWFTTSLGSEACLCGEKISKDAGYMARVAYRLMCRLRGNGSTTKYH